MPGRPVLLLGVCQCQPNCSTKACGEDDGCGGKCMTGSCPAGEFCSYGQCVCQPSCAGVACGAADGRGGFCMPGSCPGEEFCSNGACQPPAAPCPCGQVRIDGTCPPLCGTGETLCGCTSCCGLGKVCNPATLGAYAELGITSEIRSTT